MHHVQQELVVDDRHSHVNGLIYEHLWMQKNTPPTHIGYNVEGGGGVYIDGLPTKRTSKMT